MAIIGIQETDKDNDSYEIQWGDTLSRIALNNNTTVDVLAQLNGIKDPDRIQAGGSLIIPTQPRKKKEAPLPPQQAARQVAFEESAQKYAAATKEEPIRKKELKYPREDAAAIKQLEAERQKDPRWVKVPIEGGEEIWRKLKLAQTADYRDRNRNGIEDRDEGIYLPRDFEDPGRKEEDPTLNIFGRDVSISSLKGGDEGMIKRIDEKDLADATINIFGRELPLSKLKPSERFWIRPEPKPRSYAPLFESLLDERPAGEEETSWEKRHGFAPSKEKTEGVIGRVKDAVRSFLGSKASSLLSPGKAASKSVENPLGPTQPPVSVDEGDDTSYIPENISAFGKFIAGNVLGALTGREDIQGSNVDVAKFGSPQQDVLRTAMQSATKAGRNYTTYADYPNMENGERPANFYKGKRKDRSLIDLAIESFKDPVFEMFTTLGVFNFEALPDGGFRISDDPYDFAKGKSRPKDRKNPKDEYSKLVYRGQDISEDQRYKFNVSGTI